MILIKKAMLDNMAKIKKQGDGTLAQLSEAQLLWQPDQNSNSIEILVKHLEGNIRSRSTDFLTTDGEKANRVRDDEFRSDYASKEAIIACWEAAWRQFFAQVNNLSDDDFDREVSLKGATLSVTEALVTQIVHYSGHIGQMMYIGKLVMQDDWQTLSIPKVQ
ncbi:DUF1572 family protein [Kurthia sibirica]|uniref:DUF1572 domain-containing protein n=1 Tax=Kurthia sibirica TaxID=202750 RepID=A0A2U3AN82_9BACL|nr:DUF1572 family protein [Kurthia sibirica]PWI26003.1 hypothetical protein DEX24_05585 [Kurthia sibirica]GEK35278.1 hypothetical protein KSI01_28110 [Kurthia sibirica]